MKRIAALPKVLIISNEEQIRKQITLALSEEFSVVPAGDRLSAIESLKKEAMPLVLLDLGLAPHPPIEALQALDELIELNPLTKVIIVYADSERHNALAAIDKGAHDIISKPVDLNELKVVLHGVYWRVELEKENIEERNLEWNASLDEIVGTSLRRVFSVDVLECPDCGGRMRILCAINPPSAIRKILDCLGLPAKPPPISSAKLEQDSNELLFSNQYPGIFLTNIPESWDRCAHYFVPAGFRRIIPILRVLGHLSHP